MLLHGVSTVGAQWQMMGFFNGGYSMSGLRVVYGVCVILGLSVALHTEACATRNSAIPASTPTSDFAVYADGTALHKPTGLLWKRCLEGQIWNDNSCIGNATSFLGWQSTLQRVEAVNSSIGFAGRNDWRLPNVRELQSIVEQQCYNPALNPDVFPHSGTTYGVASSSPDYYFENYFWYVRFSYGTAENYMRGPNSYHVRLVSDGH